MDIEFNNRKYDNHILCPRMSGYSKFSIEQIYNLSKAIISKKSKDGLFGEAFNLSYRDILDFSSDIS